MLFPLDYYFPFLFSLNFFHTNEPKLNEKKMNLQKQNQFLKIQKYSKQIKKILRRKISNIIEKIKSKNKNYFKNT